MYKKVIKKISLVYVLQIFAVILLFGYSDSTPVSKTKELVKDKFLPLQLNKKAAITLPCFPIY
jgi:hypothetical protein